MSVSFSECTHTLLSGKPLTWAKFGEFKGGSITLKSAEARRLAQFLLLHDKHKVAEASEELFEGLISAWHNSAFDPAISAPDASTSSDVSSWRLIRLESSGFGGLNLMDGPLFVLSVGGENWCLEGQNGSGKTSIASAIIWALTGCRCSDQDGVVQDDGQRRPVFNDSGVETGTWPPMVSYPATVSKLASAATAWVRVTFQNDEGDTAIAFRKLVASPGGDPVFEVSIDPRLLSSPQLIETGLLMPARLTRIGFGERSQSIYEAVKLLTGLDQLADIGDGAASFAHKSKRFLKYAADKGIQTVEAKIEFSLKRAHEEASKADFHLKITNKREEDGYAQELLDIAENATVRASEHLGTLSSDVASELDTSKPDIRAKIRSAASTARGVLEQNAKGIDVFEAWAALKDAVTDEKFQKLPSKLADAKLRLMDAVAWDKRQTEDNKLRLKALASQFFVASMHVHEDADCPLCQSKLSGTQRQLLAAELKELKQAAAVAERKLSDVCSELENNLRGLLTQAIVSHFSMLSTMQPRDAFCEAIDARFVVEAPFSNVLTGMARFASAVASDISSTLPLFTHSNPTQPPELPASAMQFYSFLEKIERVVALAAWWNSNRQPFVEKWNALRGVADEEGNFPSECLQGKLTLLEAAIEKAAPLDVIAKALMEAASEAEKWQAIRAEQFVREAIADAIEPLKDLRTLVAAETDSTVSALSGRMKSVLDRIHFKERLSFEDAALNKKNVHVTGSFDHGIRVDVAAVANSSWLRAILWAFVLALREQTLEALGTNPFPLMVLDDPQVTFDPRNKRKWAEEIARLANHNLTHLETMQLLVITHERQFFQYLVNLENLTGQQGIVVRPNAVSGATTVVNGSSLAQVYASALAASDDKLAYEYVRDIRTYCEDLLKIMLRSEGPEVCNSTLGDLGKILHERRVANIAPFNRSFFKTLQDTISGGGGGPMKIVNEAHHIFDGTIGVAQATDVKTFWEQKLQNQIHCCFKVYAEYEAYSGEPRLFPWMDTVVSLPDGNFADIKKLGLFQTGIAAAAKSDGRVGDGLITIEEMEESTHVTLHNHDAYQLAAITLDPVATIGDVIIVSNYAKVHERNLVVVAFGEQLLARRYNETEIHPHVAVLTGQSVDPYALVQPVIVPKEKIAARKIVGTLFTSCKIPTPPKDENAEFVALSELAVVNSMLHGAKLFKVDGRSAEPVALDGQFLMTQPVSVKQESLNTLDGRLVIAVDESGARYFKRFRRHGGIALLESLNPDGSTPSEILSLSDEFVFPRLTEMLEVVGVLFELPS